MHVACCRRTDGRTHLAGHGEVEPQAARARGDEEERLALVVGELLDDALPLLPRHVPVQPHEVVAWMGFEQSTRQSQCIKKGPSVDQSIALLPTPLSPWLVA